MRELRNSYLSIFGWGVFLASALSLGSCSSDETIDAIQGEAITFGNAFVENSTRATDPSYGTANALDQFNVWGTVTGNTNNTVNVFNGATVSRGGKNYGEAWNCDTKQYWIPSATYNFMAIAHGTVTKDEYNMPLTISYTADGSTDLLLGELSNKGIKEVTTNGSAESGENPVAFTMSHLLSKAVFTFTNRDASAQLTVSDIQITGLHKTGTYTIANNTWDSNTDADPLSFGSAVVEVGKSETCTDERLIIPGTYDITISFKINDDKGGQEQEVSTTINHTFAIGNSYNFTADIKSGLKYIVFTINASDWGKESGDRPIEG